MLIRGCKSCPHKPLDGIRVVLPNSRIRKKFASPARWNPDHSWTEGRVQH